MTKYSASVPVYCTMVYIYYGIYYIVGAESDGIFLKSGSGAGDDHKRTC